MLLTLVPLLVAGAVTLEICVLIGLPLNFANIVALPLLLGVGVAFKIYYVTAWRAGQNQPAAVGLTRAIFFSALTTATAFGSLWLSSHPGTASMGKLLALSLRHHAGRGAAVPAGANGQTARYRRERRHRPVGRGCAGRSARHCRQDSVGRSRCRAHTAAACLQSLMLATRGAAQGWRWTMPLSGRANARGRLIVRLRDAAVSGSLRTQSCGKRRSKRRIVCFQLTTAHQPTYVADAVSNLDVSEMFASGRRSEVPCMRAT